MRRKCSILTRNGFWLIGSSALVAIHPTSSYSIHSCLKWQTFSALMAIQWYNFSFPLMDCLDMYLPTPSPP